MSIVIIKLDHENEMIHLFDGNETKRYNCHKIMLRLIQKLDEEDTGIAFIYKNALVHSLVYDNILYNNEQNHRLLETYEKEYFDSI